MSRAATTEGTILDGPVELAGDRARARRLVSGAEPFAAGHYPHRAIFPGVLSLELFMATAEALARAHDVNGRVRHVDRLQLLEVIEPGDALDVEATIKERRSDGLLMQCTLSAAGRKKAKATLIVSAEGQS